MAVASTPARASAAVYDGSAGTLVDTNVWIDCVDTTSPWHAWAQNEVQRCGARAPLFVNLVIYAELLLPRADVRAIDGLLAVYEAQRSELPWDCAALAARAYSLYRQRGGARSRPLPDFFIGAHAAVANLGVLTRDRSGYASYFPGLRLIAPEPA